MALVELEQPAYGQLIKRGIGYEHGSLASRSVGYLKQRELGDVHWIDDNSHGSSTCKRCQHVRSPGTIPQVRVTAQGGFKPSKGVDRKQRGNCHSEPYHDEHESVEGTVPRIERSRQGAEERQVSGAGG